MQGFICLWSGALVDIPSGWALCDGSNGTPDLRDKFIIGAGSTHAVGATGGADNHDHTFTGIAHGHSLTAGVNLTNNAPGGNYAPVTSSVVAGGTVASKTTQPPFFALAFIMKI